MARGKQDTDKDKALDLALSQIRKRFGEGAVMRLGEEPTRLKVAVIPTGALALDVALGVGGLPRGRIVELYGSEGAGKTTLALHTIAEAQKLGGMAAFIDAEHAFDRDYAERLGINLDELLISQPDTGEQALEICDTLIRSGAVDLVVIDSVAALVPRVELEGEMGESYVGLQARLMSQALRKLGGSVSQSGSVVIFINQIREKIGVMFGSPEVTPGGRALKFWASVRIDIRPRQAIKRDGEAIGRQVSIKVVKNKVAPPFKRCECDMIYGEGISQEGCILDLAVEQGLVEKSGAWYSYDDENLGQGREKTIEFLAENPDFRATLEAKVREAYGLPVGQTTQAETQEDSEEEE